MVNIKVKQKYWNANLRLVSGLLAIWFLVGYVVSIFFIGWMNQFSVGYLGFGFWMAQQGAIFVFVVLVLVYALWMDRIDRAHGLGGHDE